MATTGGKINNQSGERDEFMSLNVLWSSVQIKADKKEDLLNKYINFFVVADSRFPWIFLRDSRVNCTQILESVR